MNPTRPTHFIDFEASGIAPDSYPVEVAVVYPSGQFQALIQPVSYWEHWSYDSQDMHGLSREQLATEGSSPLEVATCMNELFAGEVLCSDVPTDSFWLDALYEAAGIESTFRLHPLEVFVGHEAAGEIIRLVPARKAHRAMPDARALAEAVESYFGQKTCP